MKKEEHKLLPNTGFLVEGTTMTRSGDVGSIIYRNILTEETLMSYTVHMQHEMHLNDLVTNHMVANSSTGQETQIQGYSQITRTKIFMICVVNNH